MSTVIGADRPVVLRTADRDYRVRSAATVYRVDLDATVQRATTVNAPRWAVAASASVPCLIAVAGGVTLRRIKDSW